ncbi:MAG: DUF1254 domain-containing protein, partial [Pseudoxanthomonas sp.]
MTIQTAALRCWITQHERNAPGRELQVPTFRRNSMRTNSTVSTGILRALTFTAILSGASCLAQQAPAAAAPSEQEISDSYIYLLGRLLVLRQEQLDFKEGFKWNQLVHRKPGEVAWPNPNLDVAYSEAWVAVDEKSCALVTVPKVTGRYYTVQFLNGWGET